MLALPRETVTVDIHCVTQWTKLDTTWTGVSLDVAAGRGRAAASALRGRPQRRRLRDEPAARRPDRRPGVAGWEYEGSPLEPPHGGPARLLVPHLYFWKSAKWVRALELLAR